MILFDKCTEEGYFLPDSETRKYCIALFGFFRHCDSENIKNFFSNDLMLKKAKEENFSFEKLHFIEAHHQCDRRTFDISYILSNIFADEQSATEYINQKIHNSVNVTKSMFNEIIILDADKVSLVISEIREYENNFKLKENIIKNEFNNFIKNLEEKYKDDDLILKLLKDQIWRSINV